ncbi:MFS transporter [Nocardioides sp. CBS4Y-1]|uniref:MFS transporter n=2 Tax=Nocardioides acrostichi TaxID=2784339 RepID=A0A930V0B4_9ACTN|nr:MFS transporter [Nocardioides acrostichi]
MIMGAVLNPINTAIIAVALVPIGRALGAPASQTAWLVSGLYLATAIGQPVVGRLVDLHGPRRLALAGSALVALGGLLGTVAPNLPLLVAARVVLGLGTCAGYPAAMALIRGEASRTGEDSPQGVLTLLTLSSQTIAVVGPTLGGLLIGLGGWRTTFLVNLPIALAAFWLAHRRMPRDHHAPAKEQGRTGLDLGGMLLFALTLTAALLFLMEPSAQHLPLLAVALALGLGFARRELRAPEPFLDVRVLGGNLPLLATFARQLLAGLTMYAVLFGFTQWLQDARGLSATHAGLLLLPLSASALGIAALTGRSPRIRLKLAVGGVFQVVGCAALLLLGPTTAIGWLVVLVLCFGVPQGLLNLGNQSALYAQADEQRMASSAGLLRTFMYLGALAASAAISAFFGQRADTDGLHHLGWFLLAGAALQLLLVALDRTLDRVGTRPAHDHPAAKDA